MPTILPVTVWNFPSAINILKLVDLFLGKFGNRPVMLLDVRYSYEYKGFFFIASLQLTRGSFEVRC